MVIHAFNLSSREAEAVVLCVFMANLVNIVSSHMVTPGLNNKN